LIRRPCSIDTPVKEWLPEWSDGGAIRLRDLLDHSSGLPAHDRFWLRGLRGRQAYLRALKDVPRQPTRTSAVYSDLGFILLGLALERRVGKPLDAQFRELAADLQLGDVAYVPPVAWQLRIAATEWDPWRGRLLAGEVHDENAWALGGVAGHAGLFGTAGAVGQFARAVLQSFVRDTPFSTPSLARLFARPSNEPSSSRALGWDTMRPTSSCGRLMSSTAIGHTGFTGTSLWVDAERDVYVALLTNRVHPTREDTRIQQLRPAVHDAILAELVD
jgi:CubicO group peptidase (beta-lactamase class C family)